MEREEARHDAGRGARSRADMEFLLGRAEICLDGVEVDFRCGAALQRRVGEGVIKGERVALRAPHHEEARAAGRGEDGLGDEAHEQAGERRVEGGAALGQNFGGGLGGEPMARGDDALLFAHRGCLRRSGGWSKSHSRSRSSFR